MAGIVQGIKSLSGINQNLATLTNQLDTILRKLEKINNVSSKTAGNIKQVVTNGGQMGNGTSGSSQMANSLAPVSTSQTRMPSQSHMQGTSESRRAFFMRNGGAQVAGGLAQTALGIGAAAFSAVPGMDVVGTNALGYYQASLGMGINPMRIQRQTFTDLRGGFSSTGSGAAAAAILRSNFIMPGTAQFRQSMQEVGGAFRYLGMSNETAAQAIGGLQTGSMSANLYQYGIRSFDDKGKPRATSEIARDLYNRMFRGKASVKDVQMSLQYGAAGANLRNMGFSEEQQEYFSQSFLAMAGGKSPDMASKGYGSKAIEGVAIKATAESKLIMEKEKPMLDGFVEGAKNVKTLNEQLEKLPDSFFHLKGRIDAVIGSQVGTGLLGLGTAISGLITTITGAMMMLGAQMGLSAMTGGKGATMGGALMKGGGALLRGAGRLGLGVMAYQGMENVQDWLNSKFGDSAIAGFGNFAFDLFQGGLAGFLTAGPGGAVVGAGAAGAGSLVNPYQNKKGGKGGQNEGTTTQENMGPILPVGNVRVSSPYGMRQVKELGHKEPKMHKGTDYAVGVGTPVKVVNDGTVIRIENSTRGYDGWHILVDHGGGWSTLYAHLSSVSVRVGEVVTKGQVIGLSGTAGTGPHLHFEARKNGVATDPAQYMSGATASNNAGLGSTPTSSPLASSVGSIASLDISGVKGRDYKLSDIYGKKSATDLLSGDSIQMGSTFAAVEGDSTGATSYSSQPIDKPNLLKLLYGAGFQKVEDLSEAYAIAMAESNGRPKAYNGNRSTGDDSYGIFQINMIDKLGEARLQKFGFMGLNKKEDLFNPELNAKIAAWMSQKGNNWSAWSSYGGTRYNDHLISPDDMLKTMSELGLKPAGGMGGGTGTDGMMATMAGSRMSGGSSTVVNHAGNTININVRVEKATEAEAGILARRVKEILEKDRAFDAIGGQ